MGLKYADLCVECGKMKTRHPSHLCCRCRSKKKQRQLCKICGQVATSSPDRICYLCRKTAAGKVENGDVKQMQEALAVAKNVVFILERRMENVSFGEISQMCGLSKSVVYERYCRAMRINPTLAGSIDKVDGTYIEPLIYESPDDDEEVENSK